jgi:DNA-binding transcriptional LysR family regulator
MDFKQLKYFVAIVDEGGYRKASSSLHISQPALTAAIKNLEADLGVSLFARTGRKVVPTAEGNHFYQHARALLSQAEKARADMASLKSMAKAEITAAAPTTIASYVLAEPIAAFMEAYPGAKVSLTQMGGPVVERALLNGEIDIGVLSRPPSSADIVAHHLYTKRICVFMRPDHALAGQPYVSWQQLFDHAIVTLPKSYVLYENLMVQARHFRRTADIILESDVVPLLASTIRKSDAIGVFLENVIEQEQGLKTLEIRSEDGKSAGTETSVTISACTLKGAPLSIAAKALLEHLELTV